jgi:hypothetical protein
VTTIMSPEVIEDHTAETKDLREGIEVSIEGKVDNQLEVSTLEEAMVYQRHAI